MAGHDCLAVLFFARERLARILIFVRGSLFPLLDFGPAAVSMSFVLHEGIFSEALRNCLPVETFVGSEIVSDRIRQISNVGLLRGRGILHIQFLLIVVNVSTDTLGQWKLIAIGIKKSLLENFTATKQSCSNRHFGFGSNSP